MPKNNILADDGVCEGEEEEEGEEQEEEQEEPPEPTLAEALGIKEEDFTR